MQRVYESLLEARVALNRRQAGGSLDPYIVFFFQISAVLFGLVIGSFLTVCIFRLPLGRPKGPPVLTEEFPDEEADVIAAEEALQEEAQAIQKAASEEVEEEEVTHHEIFQQEGVSISFPRRSYCPSCGTQLYWYNNIPLFSWLYQRGKCTACETPIPVMYPLVESLSALCALLSINVFVLSAPYSFATAFLVYLFACSLIVISFIDIDYYIIPNKITYPGVVIGAGLTVLNQFTGIFAQPVNYHYRHVFWGLIAGAGFLWMVGKTYEVIKRQQGLGLGDVKLLAMIGAFFGPGCAVYTIFMGSVVGAVLGGLALLFARQTMNRPLPFGPYLAIATLIYIFGEEAGLRELFPLPF